MTPAAAMSGPARHLAPVVFEALHREDAPRLVALLEVLGADGRLRFGGDAMASRRWNRDRYLALGGFVAKRMEAVVELFAEADDWRVVQASAFGLKSARTRWGAQLAAFAVEQARLRGAERVVWLETAPGDDWRDLIGQARETRGGALRATHPAP